MGSSTPSYRRNFLGFLFHGVFLNISGAFSQLTTIQSSFIYTLTGSSLLSGLLFTLNRVGSIVPQIFLAPVIEKRTHKKGFLLAAILIRAVSWLLIGLATYSWGSAHPRLTAGLFFGFTLVFFLAGGMGGVSYLDVLAKAIPTGSRGKLSGMKILLGGSLSLAAGYFTKIILGRPAALMENYGLLFLLTALCLFIAFFGFLAIREPAGTARHTPDYLQRILKLIREDRNFLRFVVAEFMLNTGMILFPFYVIYAREELAMPAAVIGIFVTLQVAGGLLSGPLLGWIGDHRNFRLVLIITGTAGMLTPLLALGAPLLHPYAYAAVFLLVGTTFRGISTGTDNYLMEFAPRDELPTYLAVKNTLQLPSVIFPMLGGILIPVLGYGPLFVLVAFLVGVGVLLTFRLKCVRVSSAETR
jgi:MFS family permease